MPRMALSILTALMLLISNQSVVSAGADDGRLDIYFIDVEGGAATLIVTPDGESILIDSGYPDNMGRDRDRILKVLRDEAGLKKIDHAVVSHWHLDHYGNHAALAAMIPILNFWDRGIPDALQEDNGFDERIANYRAASQNESKRLAAGDIHTLKSEKTPLTVKVLSGSREVVPNIGEPNPFADEHVPQPEDTSDNAASLTVLFQFGEFRFLCCGDLTWNVEAELVTPNNAVGKVDLFMATHHGLGVSNNPVFVKAIDPVTCVMCNGPTKGGDPRVIATIRETASFKALYQLHRNIGLSAEMQAPNTFIANEGTTDGCQGEFIKASVAPDGSSYTIQIGSKGDQTKYTTRSDH
ncbi:ComEC/Rec2 family competence protein [Planctomicrobium sp. SH668]|uniref:ComEC/Rec2 family competence protein n=1 Tax=Planctomicrobium sp. SH668 TaxID=3448126 RepID=UPI003F5BB46D